MSDRKRRQEQLFFCKNLLSVSEVFPGTIEECKAAEKRLEYSTSSVEKQWLSAETELSDNYEDSDVRQTSAVLMSKLKDFYSRKAMIVKLLCSTVDLVHRRSQQLPQTNHQRISSMERKIF